VPYHSGTRRRELVCLKEITVASRVRSHPPSVSGTLDSSAVVLLVCCSSAQPSRRLPQTHSPDYRPGESDGGVGAGTVAGIAAGVGLAGAAASGAFGGGLFGAGGADECREPRPALPERFNQFSEIRLVPGETTLEAGRCRCFFLEVRAAEDREWYSVTHRASSTIELQEQSECVVKRGGSKNAFCVPVTAARNCDGRSVTVVGTYAHPGQSPMTATARILVRVPEERR
jgi:hypothetical protein